MPINMSNVEYNLAVIRQLMSDAFDDITLRRFCQDRALFRPALTEFSSSAGLANMIDGLIDYCRRHLLFPELLSGIESDNPRQYGRYKARLSRAEYRLLVYETSRQRTELRTSADGLELWLDDERANRKKGLQWTLTSSQLRKILQQGAISISPASRYPKSGTFSIGPRRNWYYSKSLFDDPQLLHRDICTMIEKTIEQHDSFE